MEVVSKSKIILEPPYSWHNSVHFLTSLEAFFYTKTQFINKIRINTIFMGGD